jgi:hypothetical protein
LAADYHDQDATISSIHHHAIIDEASPPPPGLHRKWNETTIMTNSPSSSSSASMGATSGRRSRRRSRRERGGRIPRSEGMNAVVERLAYFTSACRPLADDDDDDGRAKRHYNQLTKDIGGCHQMRGRGGNERTHLLTTARTRPS